MGRTEELGTLGKRKVFPIWLRLRVRYGFATEEEKGFFLRLKRDEAGRRRNLARQSGDAQQDDGREKDGGSFGALNHLDSGGSYESYSRNPVGSECKESCETSCMDPCKSTCQVAGTTVIV